MGHRHTGLFSETYYHAPHHQTYPSLCGSWSPLVQASWAQSGKALADISGSRARLQLETGHPTHREPVSPHPISLKVFSNEGLQHTSPSPYLSPPYSREICAREKLWPHQALCLAGKTEFSRLQPPDTWPCLRPCLGGREAAICRAHHDPTLSSVPYRWETGQQGYINYPQWHAQ